MNTACFKKFDIPIIKNFANICNFRNSLFIPKQYISTLEQTLLIFMFLLLLMLFLMSIYFTKEWF